MILRPVRIRFLFICALCSLASCTRSPEHHTLPKLFVSIVAPCGAPNAGKPLEFAQQNQKVCLDRSPLVTEADVVSARLEKAFPGRPIVRLSLRDEVSKRLREATGKHMQEQIGIVLKGEPLSAPMIVEPVSDMYLGPFSEAQAKELMRQFNSGSRE